MESSKRIPGSDWHAVDKEVDKLSNAISLFFHFVYFLVRRQSFWATAAWARRPCWFSSTPADSSRETSRPPSASASRYVPRRFLSFNIYLFATNEERRPAACGSTRSLSKRIANIFFNQKNCRATVRLTRGLRLKLLNY